MHVRPLRRIEREDCDGGRSENFDLPVDGIFVIVVHRYRSRPEPSLKYLGIVSVRERPNAPTPVAGGFSEKDDLPVAGTGPCDVSCDM